MPRKTRKSSHKRTSKRASGIHTIPELRQSFDYIDTFVAKRAQSGLPKEKLVREVQTEWRRVFLKSLSKASATALVEQQLSKRGNRRITRKRGGSAPLEYTTRPGIHLPQGGVPPPPYGHYTSYVSSGFEDPQIAGQVEGVAWPAPSAVMGSNRVQGGGRPLHKKQKGGSLSGAFLTQAFSRPIMSFSPSTILQDGQSLWQGGPIGPSSDQVQRSAPYSLTDSMFPKPITVDIDV